MFIILDETKTWVEKTGMVVGTSAMEGSSKAESPHFLEPFKNTFYSRPGTFLSLAPEKPKSQLTFCLPFMCYKTPGLVQGSFQEQGGGISHEGWLLLVQMFNVGKRG